MHISQGAQTSFYQACSGRQHTAASRNPSAAAGIQLGSSSTTAVSISSQTGALTHRAQVQCWLQHARARAQQPRSGQQLVRCLPLTEAPAERDERPGSASATDTSEDSRDKGARELVEVRGGRRLLYRLRHSSQPVIEALSSEAGGSDFVGAVKGFFLPRGYPDSVTDDYLPYQMWAVLAHVTGWLSLSLSTSSLLKAVGLSAGAAGVTGATAAIKWITKDGIGAIGRSLVGGRLSGVFDEDPKRWRMVAEGVNTAGLALEIATAFHPGSFLLLAGAGNFAKATAKGMGRPCFRIIQTHFAAANNVGDVAAKEEVWEVVGQLAGLAASVGALRAVEATGKPEAVIWAWAAAQGCHVALRYASLAALRLPWLNQKRACALVAAHVAGRPVPTVAKANEIEASQILLFPTAVSPPVHLGCSVEDALAAAGSSESLEKLVQLHAEAGMAHVLLWREGHGLALLYDSATPTTYLQVLWQAAWLQQSGVTSAGQEDAAASLHALGQQFAPGFEAAVREAGWDPSRMVLNTSPSRLAHIAAAQTSPNV